MKKSFCCDVCGRGKDQSILLLNGFRRLSYFSLFRFQSKSWTRHAQKLSFWSENSMHNLREIVPKQVSVRFCDPIFESVNRSALFVDERWASTCWSIVKSASLSARIVRNRFKRGTHFEYIKEYTHRRNRIHAIAEYRSLINVCWKPTTRNTIKRQKTSGRKSSDFFFYEMLPLDSICSINEMKNERPFRCRSLTKLEISFIVKSRQIGNSCTWSAFQCTRQWQRPSFDCNDRKGSVTTYYTPQMTIQKQLILKHLTAIHSAY